MDLSIHDDQPGVRMNIIVASNDDTLRRSLADLLTGPSDSVEMTPKSSDLIRWVLDKDFDVIVVDVELLGMDGVESLPILKQVRPKVPIVMISSDTSTDVSRQIAEAGVFYHFVKPVNATDLIQVVRAAGAGRRVPTG